MNILPHKSWHVRTKKNIERVRRDEEKAAAEEKEKQRRVALAEQEARTEILRGKVRQRSIAENPEATVSEAVAPSQRTHINFFSAIENEEEPSNRKNLEHEAEEKAKKEEWEKKIGLLTYLGQSAMESQTVPPWYLDKKHKKQEATGSEQKPKKVSDLSADPLHEMEKYLKHKHHKKHKHDKKKEKKKSKMKALSSGNSPKVSIEQLRAERLQRESKEKEKAHKLFIKMKGGSVPEKRDPVVSERDRQYSSQYNPSFARQNKPRNEQASAQFPSKFHS